MATGIEELVVEELHTCVLVTTQPFPPRWQYPSTALIHNCSLIINCSDTGLIIQWPLTELSSHQPLSQSPRSNYEERMAKETSIFIWYRRVWTNSLDGVIYWANGPQSEWLTCLSSILSIRCGGNRNPIPTKYTGHAGIVSTEQSRCT